MRRSKDSPRSARKRGQLIMGKNWCTVVSKFERVDRRSRGEASRKFPPAQARRLRCHPSGNLRNKEQHHRPVDCFGLALKTRAILEKDTLLLSEDTASK